MKRRAFLAGMAGILASGVAPGVGHTGIVMPVRRIIAPPSLAYEDVTCTIAEYGRLYEDFTDPAVMQIGRFDGFRFVESPSFEPTGMQMLVEEQQRLLTELAAYGVLRGQGLAFRPEWSGRLPPSSLPLIAGVRP